MAEPPRLDVVVLAGGGGQRMGGVSKADLTLHGKRLLDHILDDLAGWDDSQARLGRVVVVAPDSVAVRPGVLRTLEEPPGGGPAAGVAAALAVLGDGDLVAVLTCDAPRSALALPALLSALAGDGAVVLNRGGFHQYLLGVYRFPAVARRIGEEDGARDTSARRLLGSLDLVAVDAGDLDHDVDTWEDLATLQ